MPKQDATSSLATKPTLLNTPWPAGVAPATTESVCLVPSKDGENCGVYFLPVSGEVIHACICVYMSPPVSPGPVENLPGVSKGPNATCNNSTSDLWSGTTTGEPRTSCHAKKTILSQWVRSTTRPSNQGYPRRPLYDPGLCRGVSVSGTL